ncbi:MAG: Uma2 family endonuclease [Burkholderiaceae bacterium]
MGQGAAKLDVAAYLVWENQQATRNELYRGEVFAMVGVRRVHGKVALNVAIALSRQLKGSPCEVFTESLKVQTDHNSIFYPDVFVTCDRADLQTELIFTAPTVIVEVLSESTQAYDRGLKFAAYRQIAALREYLLIDPDTRVVELYRRGAEGLFTLHDHTGQAQFSLTSIGCELTAADIFDGLDAHPQSDAAAV